VLVIAASRSRTFVPFHYCPDRTLVAVARGLPFPKSFDTILGVSPSTAAVASSPKLLDRVRWHLRVKHYSMRTEQAYVDWIRRYILFHRKRHQMK
jgi:Phage integrase, N-terminal SAM-like domain